MKGTEQPLFYSVLLVFIGLILASSACGPTSTPTPTLTPSPTPTPTEEIITEPGVLRRIESTMKLQTTVFRIDTVVRAKKEGGIFNLGGQNLLLFVKGIVTAGIDLSELDADNIEVLSERKVIIITLPQAKVLDAKLDEYEVENYRGEEPEKVDLTLLTDGLEAGREQIARTACEDGILERATTDAKTAYEQMISFADLMDYEVIVNTTPAGECSIDVEITQ